MNEKMDNSSGVQEVICVALNHRAHMKKMKPQFRQPPYKEVPKTPVLFIKPRNTISTHLADVPCPATADIIQPGPSLAVVIGSRACRVKANEAMNYIQGYTIFNDFSLPERSYFRPAITDKCFDASGPLSAEVIDKNKINDPHKLTISTFVNGELCQRSCTDEMLWEIPVLIEFISSFKTLFPGEVIATGFPAERIDVSVGDVVNIAIEGVGQLSNRVISDREYYQL